MTDLCAQQTIDNRRGMLHGCRTGSQEEAEQQISPAHTARFQKEEEEISGQMGDIIPAGYRPTVSTLPLMPSMSLNRGRQLAVILTMWAHLFNWFLPMEVVGQP